MMKSKSPWAWVPTLYFTQGIPYVIVMTVAVIMYKRLGISNTDIAIYTSWLYLPWVIKPLWSPIVDLFKTKRWWIVVTQLLVGAGLAGIALTIPAPDFFRYTLAIFWLIAFSSATYDIAADGFYMLALKQHEQAYFIGIRSTFYRIAMITGQGLLIIIAGFFETYTGLEPLKFDVQAVTAPQVLQQLPAERTANEQDKPHFVLNYSAVQIPIEGITSQVADSIKAETKASNLNLGFVLPEPEAKAVEKGWWAKQVSMPMGAWLKKVFGRDEAPINLADLQGNLAVVEVSLSKAPEGNKEVILNVNQRGGDNSIRLVTGERLIFSTTNWNKGAKVLLQLDPKLTTTTTTHFEGRSGNIPLAWSITFFILAALFICFFVYHRLALPRPANDHAVIGEGNNAFKEFFTTFADFFRKENIGPALFFILMFRFGEAQLSKIASPFLLDTRAVGGLGLTTGDVGLVYGTIGILALTLGGIIGGILASRQGLKHWIWWMTLALNLPSATYIYLACMMPDSLITISLCVAVEQLGYGFGFTAYMLYLIHFCEGKHKTAHYALCTGFMALGMMIPGMFSGWVQDVIGYKSFFIWVILCGVPALLALKFLKIDPKFGRKDRLE